MAKKGGKGLNLLQEPKFFFFFIAAVALDLISKLYVNSSIAKMALSTPFYPYGGKAVFYNWHGIDLSIVHATNKGAAWGLFALFQSELMIARGVIIGALILYTLFWNRNREHLFPLTLVISGAVANFLDFFIFGHVVDMIRFCFFGYHYPVFNIADSLIFIGVALLFWQGLFASKKKFSAV